VNRSSEGFSLLEVIAALFILSVGILAIAQLFSINLRSIGRSDRQSLASAYAHSLLEEAYASEGIDGLEGTYQLESGFEAARTVQQISAEELENSEGAVSVYEIRVVIVWPPKGHLELAGKKMVYEIPE